VSPGTSPTAKTAMLKKTGTLRPTAAAAVPAAVVKRQMLTWEVLKDIYGVATYHMVDNKNYSGIVITQNMLVKVRIQECTHNLRIRSVMVRVLLIVDTYSNCIVVASLILIYICGKKSTFLVQTLKML
jgi:hypothetical protein